MACYNVRRRPPSRPANGPTVESSRIEWRLDMEPAHAWTLVQARSYVAALADGARAAAASSAYEHVLIELDRIHGDRSPALDTDGLTGNRDLLLAVASCAIEDLQDHGIDVLDVELLLARLDEARGLDGS
jgi:hypothetical protein